jgi:hypothetical protein
VESQSSILASGDVQQVHEALVVIGGGELDRWGRRLGWSRESEGEQQEGCGGLEGHREEVAG